MWSGQPAGRARTLERMNRRCGRYVQGFEARSLGIVLGHRLKLLTEGNQLEQTTLRDWEIRSLNQFYRWILTMFPEHPRRREHLRGRTLQSPIPRTNLMQEPQNRLRANGEGGGGLERIWCVLGLKPTGRDIFKRHALGPGDPARSSRAT